MEATVHSAGAVGIADGDVGTDHAGNPFSARHERENKTDTMQPRPDLRRPGGVWIGNPNVDVYIVVQGIGKRNQFDFLWKIPE